MEISVVVPTFNRRETVTRTLATLFAQDASPASYEMIVVVDGSTDGTGEALRAIQPACRFRVIEQDNQGPSAARNTGFRSAETELVLFLDDDMLCDPRLISAHIAAHRAGGRMVGFGALFLSADSPRTLAAECFHREIGALHLQRRRNSATPWHAGDCVFSNSSLPRALLEEIGGFDEQFRMREDLELGIRLFAAGVVPRYIDEAIAYQYYDKTAADLIHDAEAFAPADVLLARKHPTETTVAAVSRLAMDPHWKQTLRRFAARSPATADRFLSPFCSLGEAFLGVPILRSIGARALQMRRRIHWLHKVNELSARSSET
jgi:glycosyltransferase involved in cell wall biosynthesis